jgi:Domain of unknown function (DUF5062)
VQGGAPRFSGCAGDDGIIVKQLPHTYAASRRHAIPSPRCVRCSFARGKLRITLFAAVPRRDTERRGPTRMKKLKHEAELFKGALLAGVKYAEDRKAAEFEATDSASLKLQYIYRLLIHDKIIQPLPEDQVSEASMRHKLAIWYSKQLPKDHPLLK